MMMVLKAILLRKVSLSRSLSQGGLRKSTAELKLMVEENARTVEKLRASLEAERELHRDEVAKTGSEADVGQLVEVARICEALRP